MKPVFFAIGTLLASAAFSALAANPVVELDTTKGKIKLELYPEAAPKTVENFVNYVKSGHYDGVQFHRVIKGFMIQTGGYTPEFKEKSTKKPIQNEAEQALKAGLKNEPGTIAMARTNDPHSASAQFFINVAPNVALDWPSRDGWGYAVFGKVVDGMNVVNTIAEVEVAPGPMPHQHVPKEKVVITKATLVSDGGAKK